ncbi:leucine-rich repeat protein [Candidatus Odyssella thessalonicensis]|uniref:leucine-rich repeat protein n=1 Tax=Candidatus Odyssella thessalonicensis TaxID=84647 RepID=UPI000225A9AE|nr:leucine-rich repeat protein [Candidatus Odyssella thessalonicensis]
MKFYQLLLMGCLWTMTCKANDRENKEQFNFLDLPLEIVTNIAALSDAETSLALRTTCRLTKECVDEFYLLSLKKNFNTFTETFEAEFEEFPLEYKKSLFKSIATNLLNNDGCFFVPQTSWLERDLSKDYLSISLYRYLKKDKAWAQELFSTLFDKRIPKKNADLALTLLMACLPVTHIYGAPEISDSSRVVQRFKEVHHETLIRALKKLKAEHGYFLVGLDHDKKRLTTKPHFIVVNQSNAEGLKRLNQEGYLPDNHPHTIVYNIDEKNATSICRDLNIGKLILTNINNKCTSIGPSCLFLRGCTNLTSLDMRGLSNLTAIGASFLERCITLTSLNMRGLSNLTSIGSAFLRGCIRITFLDTRALFNVTTIREFFLAECTNLTFLDMRGLSNLTSIKYFFLYRCTSLNSLNTEGLPAKVLTRLKASMENSTHSSLITENQGSPKGDNAA